MNLTSILKLNTGSCLFRGPIGVLRLQIDGVKLTEWTPKIAPTQGGPFSMVKDADRPTAWSDIPRNK